MLTSRDQVMDELNGLSSRLPLHHVELDNAFGEVKMKATKEYAKRCEDAGVPEDDVTWEEHLSELNRMLDDKQQIIEQENERKILETIAAVLHKYEDLLREQVDELISDTDAVGTDLAVYIEKHDSIKEKLWDEIKEEIKIASKDQVEAHYKKFEKLSKDVRSRNIERVRLIQLAEAEKKQKLMLGLMGVFIILAIGIDGDPFDEIFSVLRLLWFLPIICAGGAGYFFMYGSPPPYSMEAMQMAYTASSKIREHIMVEEEEKPKKE